ncbi:hypothetical protein H6G93_28085 [Nostoc sp. FACHB-973]|nr:hypothetical protein [Nostoc sp. FACHB-973]
MEKKQQQQVRMSAITQNLIKPKYLRAIALRYLNDIMVRCALRQRTLQNSKISGGKTGFFKRFN